jgi:hypothetical protein
MACSCRQEGDHPLGDARPSGVYAANRWWIDLSLGRLTSRVELPRLVVVRVLGQDVARLDDLWAAGHLGVRAEELSFDFVGWDGFHLAAKLEGGVQGSSLATGYVCIATRDLLWAPTPERPDFWRVKGVVKIVASRAPDASRSESKGELR